jgi:mono/diheme cytochrome c family protein
MKNGILKPLVISALVLVALFHAFASSGDSRSPLDRARNISQQQQNPYQDRAAAERAGAKLFLRHCSACHGRDARGIGKAPSLVSDEVRNAEPGELYWVLRNGSLTSGMPSFSKLPEAQRWQIIAWLQRLNEAGTN